jgi:phosphinothricin acetyltransferase
MEKKIPYSIRPAQKTDLPGITIIYNEAIKNSNATFDTETKTLQEQYQWYDDHGSKNPIIVAENNREIIGWAALSKWSDRCAYSDTAEISLYVKEKFQKEGIGTQLLEHILNKGKLTGIHTIIARITEGNDESIKLHERYGFEHIGRMKEVGIKFGKRLDVYLLQKIYQD